MKRRDAMSDVCAGTWKWFEVASGKWQEYQAANNKTINDAFWAGEQSVKFSNGRKKYNVQFGAMMQANEESGSKKPIMITLKRDSKQLKKDEKESLNNIIAKPKLLNESDSKATEENKDNEESAESKGSEEQMETTNDASKTEDEQGKYKLKLFFKFLHVLNIIYCFSFNSKVFVFWTE